MEIVFSAFLLLTAYSYALFPSLLWVMQGLLRKPWKQSPVALSVSMIISVHNEEAVIQEKIVNTLALDYPANLLEVIICSDGSTDQTHEIVARFQDPRVVLKKYDRLGKSECLNRVVPYAHGDIVLLTDANSIFPLDLLRNLSANFSDPDVGLVTGWTKYLNAQGDEEVTGVYARLEKQTKYWESLIASCVGADGAVFAIRKVLYRPLGADDINDFIIPLNVVRQQKRVILDPKVFCYEKAADSDQKAYRRQVRITTRTLWALRRNLDLLNFANYGLFSLFLLSHKFLRLSVPFFFMGAFVLNIKLIGTSWFYNFVFLGFSFFFFLGFINLSGLTRGKFSSICKFFLITFSAQITGWMRMAIGIRDKTWTPQR